MTNPSPLESIFFAALEKPSSAERMAFLDEACAENVELRGSVERMLAAQADAGSFLERPAPALGATSDVPSREQPGAQIGPYKLRELLGEGGMGSVFVAEQEQPIRRKVALKIIKPGMDTRQVLARFDAERQALALMDHPNIAKVLDAGTTDSGRPYFVMELVRGVPITEFCDQRRLDPRQRLALYIQVCRAIQHAHQKGIIHRDIKPSNILVTLHDTLAVPKVIDFGIAKATGQRMTEQSVYTALNQMIGTPLYMSPEQAEMNALDVDTRSDVYSLGVLLYELLTGSTPFDSETLRQAGFDEMRRLIREVDPPRPSQRVSTLDAEADSTVSHCRGVDERRLGRILQGELDWIVMKALEKDRSRRYESASALAADVERYLSDEPVEACPPSAGYRLRKFVRRNKGAVAAGFALAALLLLGTVCTSIGLVWALRAERTATVERDRADAAQRLAEEEAAISKAVNDFLQFELLAQADPEQNARDKKVTVEELLGRAAARIAGKFEKQPRVEAAIRQTIGTTYLSLGNYPAAQLQLERAWEIRRKVLGDESPETLDTMSNLANLYRLQGQLDKAEPLHVQALELSRRVLGEDHEDTLTSMNNLAALYTTQGQYAKAELLFAKALEILRRKLGEENPDTLAVARNLAHLYQEQHQFDKAEALSVETLEITRSVLGEEHPDTLLSMNNLGALYKDQGQFAKTEPLFLKALEVRRRVLGEEHPLALASLNNLASLYYDQRQYAKAEPLFVKALEGLRRVEGDGHPHTLTTMDNLANLYLAQGQFAKAEPLHREALENSRKSHGEASPSVAVALANLSLDLLRQQKYVEAERLLRECLTIREQKEPGDWRTFNTKSMLGGSLLGQQNYAEAETLLLAGYEGMLLRADKIPAQGKIRLTEALARLVELYTQWNKPDEAAKWQKELSFPERT